MTRLDVDNKTIRNDCLPVKGFHLYIPLNRLQVDTLMEIASNVESRKSKVREVQESEDHDLGEINNCQNSEEQSFLIRKDAFHRPDMSHCEARRSSLMGGQRGGSGMVSRRHVRSCRLFVSRNNRGTNNPSFFSRSTRGLLHYRDYRWGLRNGLGLFFCKSNNPPLSLPDVRRDEKDGSNGRRV
jgi:hypothetical protein